MDLVYSTGVSLFGKHSVSWTMFWCVSYIGLVKCSGAHVNWSVVFE